MSNSDGDVRLGINLAGGLGRRGGIDAGLEGRSAWDGDAIKGEVMLRSCAFRIRVCYLESLLLLQENNNSKHNISRPFIPSSPSP